MSKYFLAAIMAISSMVCLGAPDAQAKHWRDFNGCSGYGYGGSGTIIDRLVGNGYGGSSLGTGFFANSDYPGNSYFGHHHRRGWGGGCGGGRWHRRGRHHH